MTKTKKGKQHFLIALLEQERANHMEAYMKERAALEEAKYNTMNPKL